MVCGSTTGTRAATRSYRSITAGARRTAILIRLLSSVRTLVFRAEGFTGHSRAMATFRTAQAALTVTAAMAVRHRQAARRPVVRRVQFIRRQIRLSTAVTAAGCLTRITVAG